MIHRMGREALEKPFADSCRERCMIGSRRNVDLIRTVTLQLGQPQPQPTGHR